MVWVFGLISLVGMTQVGGLILGVETVSLYVQVLVRNSIRCWCVVSCCGATCIGVTLKLGKYQLLKNLIMDINKRYYFSAMRNKT